jgi:hypothetical protein
MRRVIMCISDVDVGRPAPTSETGRLTVTLTVTLVQVNPRNGSGGEGIHWQGWRPQTGRNSGSETVATIDF